MVDTDTALQRQPTGKLTATVGATACAALLSIVPLMESGRHVDTVITSQHDVVITHQDPIRYTRAYQDTGGVWTICDGVADGVTRATTMSQQQCTSALLVELNDKAVAVQKCTPLDKSRYGYQLVAYVDFAYNLGPRKWCRSSAAKAARRGDLLGSCTRLLLYNKGRVNRRLVVIPGLDVRRRREQAYCQTGLTPSATPQNLAERLKGL